MKKLLLLLLCVPLIGLGQFSVGNDQTICLGDSSLVITTLGPSTTGCSGVTDSLTCPNAGGNGFAGNIFNIINTSSSSITITGFSQGGITTASSVDMEVWMYAGDYLPLINDTISWTMVGSATVNLVAGVASGHIPVSGVIIPAGATYGFRVGSTGASINYTNGTGTSGVTTWQSNSDLTITEGHGGGYPFYSQNTPRNWNGTIHYGGGSSWFDVNSGQFIGSGDSLVYAPSQTTDVCAVLNCNGITYSDTMTITVLNTNLSTTGFSLCNGVVVLTAPSNFSNYNWSNGASTNPVLTVNTPGVYYVNCITSNGLTCQSDPITIYSGNIPITLSTTDSVFICQGDTVVMDGPLGFTTYNWNTGATTSSISTTLTGNYSLTVIDGNGCTGTSNTTSVSISPQTIAATTTGFSLCNGSVTLNAGSGFSSYQWYNNGTIIPNATNQTFIANITGNYSIEVTYPTGCTATSNTLTIYTGQFYFFINTIGDDSLCLPNGQVILDAGNYPTFNWSTGETTQQITVNTLGSYYVNVTDGNGCTGVSNPPFTVSNIVNTSAITGPTNPLQYQTVTYSVSPSSGSTYNWTLVGGTIESGQGTNSIDVIWNNSGMFSFSVIETDVNGCIGEEVSLIVNVIFNSVEDINSNIGKLTKITDVLGRESEEKSNVPLFYIFYDGTVEKKIIIE
ncbi:MAG: hypothetical protein HOG85_00800 [Flavobacteriales bacterium]|nr:hypothetical protein [Flavobacteriales bacterium]